MIRRHSGSATEPSDFVGSPSSTMPGHALGEARREGAREADDDAGLVHRRRAVDRDQVALVVEVVLDELAARDRAGGIAPLGRQHLDQLGRVHGAAAAGLHDPPRALVQRLQRTRRRLVDLDDHAAAGGREQAQLAVVDDAVARVAHAAADDHGLDAEALGLAGVAVDQRARLVRREVDRPATGSAARGSTAGARAASGGPGSAAATPATRPACARARAARRRARSRRARS